MSIVIKEMILKITKINETQYTREVFDMRGNLVWSGGKQYYIYENEVVMTAEKMSQLVAQMKQFPSLNIVEVQSDFDQ